MKVRELERLMNVLVEAGAGDADVIFGDSYWRKSFEKLEMNAEMTEVVIALRYRGNEEDEDEDGKEAGGTE